MLLLVLLFAFCVDVVDFVDVLFDVGVLDFDFDFDAHVIVDVVIFHVNLAFVSEPSVDFDVYVGVDVVVGVDVNVDVDVVVDVVVSDTYTDAHIDCIVHVVVGLGVVVAYDVYIGVDVCIRVLNDFDDHGNLVVNVVVDRGIRFFYLC